MGRRTGIPVQAPFFFETGKLLSLHNRMQSPCHICTILRLFLACATAGSTGSARPTRPTMPACNLRWYISSALNMSCNFPFWKITFPYRISLLAIGSFTKCRQLSGSGGSTEVLELAIDTGSVVEKQLELPKDGCLIPKKMGISGWQMRYQPNKMQEGWYVMICIYIYMHVFVQYI